MKLTKKQETEIWQVYDAWLHAYLNGDLATYGKFLDKDYHFIGSTNNEEFLNKKDTTNFFEATADQLAGKCDLRNENKIIEKFEGLVFVTHLFDAWFKTENDWAYYGRFRFTNALKENKEGWRFIYQHFSTTDSKTDEGETIGFDKVNAENIELKEAIKRRTFELEQKNRELEVETALERIRAQAVAMKESSDLLDIVVTMRNEFIKLGHEAHYFWHMMWLPETYEKAMTSGDGSKIGFVMQLPRHIHGNIPLLAKWEKSKKPTVVYTMNVEEAIDYVDKMVNLGDFKNIDPQAPTHDDIRHIGGLTFIMARTTHGEIGFSLPGIVKNPPKGDIDILVKFSGAFDLAHQRFLDLQKAEKQAKETQVELSLERIRSRVAEMKASSDLFDIVVTMRNEFLSLGHQADYFWHMKWTKENYEMSMTAEDGGRLGMVITVPKFVHEQIESLHNWEKSNSPYFVLALNGKEAWDYIENMNTYGQYKQVDPHAPSEEDILHIGGLTFIIARTTHGEIGFSLAGEVHNPPKASIEILLRFAKVFDLAYKRFEDLQKAEAQARETQIELALEKVRSRTMAMQHSDELQEASFLLDQQVRALGIKTWGCAFNIYGEKESTEWFGNEKGVLPTYSVPRKGIFKEYYQKGQKGESFYNKEFSGKTCVDHYEYMSSLPVIGDVLKNLKKTNKGFPTYQIDHVAYFKYGYLLFITKEHVPDAHDVFKRFAKVFEQTYTRFLDLQKAEAQARESEIELALERVRARTMAMQHSDELAETAALLFKQISDLGIETWTSGFNIWEKNDTSFIGYNPTPSGEITAPYQIPSTEDSFFKKIYNAKQNGEDFLVFKASDKSLADTYKYMKTLPVVKDVLQGIEDSGTQLPKSQINHSAFFSHGFLLFITLEPYPEAHDVFKRFAKVFEQTYTRFLDLQKAEEQAREAQIEAALERVRSRSMAMHKSEELLEAGALLYSELSKLGIKHLTTGYILFDDKAEIGYSYGVNPADGSIRPKPVGMIHNQTKTMKSIVASWKKQEPLLVIELNEKETIKHQTFIAEKSTNFPLTAAQLLAISPKHLVIHCFNFKQGYLLIVGGNRLLDKQQEMVVRFAKVFQQTYTRFLDLQKAEAQAKEAQIEAALERVRSRSMAMHKSEEIGDVAFVLFEQLKSLGGELWGTGFGFCKTDSKVDEFWFANENGIMPHLKIPNNVDEAHKKMYQGWEEKLELFSIEKGGKELKDHYKYMLTIPDVQPIFQGMLDNGIKFPKWQKWHAAYFKYGYMLVITTQPYQNETIFKRFAKVFEQAYTRFLDLQKAEEQTKEALIEAALERTRTQSMLMQHSDELDATSKVFHEQLRLLGIDTEFSYVWLPDEAKNEHQFWVAWNSEQNKKDINSKAIIYPLDKTEPYTAACFKDWSSGITVHIHHIKPKEIKTFFSAWEELLKDAKNLTPKYFSNGLYYAEAFMKYGCFGINIKRSITEEEKQILQRFSIEFERTYTRFLDLQKAEAQAKEAQIQLALERVRARTMAMQSSEELIETSELLFQQIKELGIEVWSCGYSLWYDDDSYFIGYNPMPNGKMGPTFKIPLTEDIFFKTIRKAKREGKEFLVFESKGKSLVKTYEYMDTLPVVGEAMRAIVDSGYELPKYQVTHCGFFAHGHLMFITHQHYPEAHDIFKRFTKEFEQTYTRFLDLQKAEAQARESQIETALERVRSRSMAMHNSEELKEVIQVLYDQFIHLNIKIEHAGFILDYKENDDMHIWLADHNAVFPKIVLPYFDCAHWNSFIEAKKKGQQFFANTLGFEEKNKFYKDLFQFIPDLPEETKKTYLAFKGLAISTVLLDNVGLYIENYSGTPFSEEDNKILMRFGTVFQQSYTRFLDLQRAEAQAKEAQIETALERVRSQSMGMQTSKDLSRVTTEMFNQLRQFGGDLFATGIVFCDKHEGHVEQWHSLPDAGMMSPFIVPIDLDYIHQYRYDEWKKGTELFSVEIPSDFIKQHFQDIFNLPSAQKVLKDFEDQNTPMPEAPPWEIDYGASFKHGYILVSSLQPFKEAEILPRFAKVFEQTYTRFLDLQKAETQAREAQINLAVERVRAKALAMHKSEEIIEVVAKLKDEVMSLDIPNVIAATIFLKEGEDNVRMWDLSSLEKLDGVYQSPLDITFKLKKTDPHLYPKRVWENPDNYFVIIQDTKGFKRIIAWLREHNKHEVANETEAFIEASQLKQLYHAAKKLNNGKLVIDLLDSPSDEMETILTKMGAAFDLAYKRFEDLKKAEAQARESLITVGLERVRSRTLAMQTSDELAQTSVVVFQQLLELGIAPNRLFIGIIKENGEQLEAWATNEDGSKIETQFTLHNSKNKSIKKMIDGWKQKKNSLVIDMRGKELQDYFRYLNEDMDIPFINGLKQKRRVQTIAYFSGGLIGMAAPEEQPDETITLLERFAAVFNLTYTRFNDLKVAEAQAREAQIETALEKVRSRTMAMQNSSELPEAANNLFLQVQALGIPAWSAGYCIWEAEDKKSAWCNMSSEGEIQKGFSLPSIGEGYNFYKPFKNKESFHVAELGGKALVKHYDFMKKLPIVGEVLKEFGEKGIALPTFQIFHIVYFTHGYLMFITYEAVPDAHQIFKRFGQVFEQTYTRFLDLKKAEAQSDLIKKEKERLEVTLSELKATQSQLIQSEKMASLGELTAGIAHEIQNPLNFVNNFSEVSKELLDEMLEEIENGDMEEVKAIMDDVIQNLEKINHHGKRADGIVKGMLQHSRASGDKKEPTNINDLADEYLRLAYHGLRAKDKSFNATLETDYDDTLEKIKVIPQDIGRVVLNLLTNAFYVVNEKKQSNQNGFEPTVKLSTKKNGNWVTISVKDNGNGIPKHVLEKIFQPFFTTKPTGQGTGLGLSMSYDIVTKGHGGELKVNTEQNKGTEFIIKLPIRDK